MQNKVLLVDDNHEFVDSTRSILELINYKVKVAHNVADAKQLISEEKFTHLLLDLMLPDGSGLNIIEDLNEQQLKALSITMITGHPVVKTAVKSMFGPNISYLIKPVSFKDLRNALDLKSNATAIVSDISEKNDDKSSNPLAHFDIDQMLIGKSAVTAELKRDIKLVAKTDVNVLITGESGVGKEVIAHAIHSKSSTKGEFVAMNCGALNKELVNSELFGHEKGAFTGAINRKIGVFEQAHSGTLFLDEITEMPLELQPNLLRALETKSIVRVGGNTKIPADCRVISASNRCESEIAEKSVLRQDLYFRLAVYPIHIPPLRQRTEDIGLLADHFLALLNDKHDTDIQIDTEGLSILESYTWPGNIRELKHAIQRAYIRTEAGSHILQVPKNISSPYSNSSVQNPSDGLQAGRRLDEVEKDLILLTLDRFNGDKSKTAKVLGVSTKTIYNRLEVYGVKF